MATSGFTLYNSIAERLLSHTSMDVALLRPEVGLFPVKVRRFCQENEVTKLQLAARALSSDNSQSPVACPTSILFVVLASSVQ